LLPAPTAPSEGSAGVRNLVRFRPKAWADPLSILAHQLRRRFPSDRSFRRRALTTTGLRFPRVRLSFAVRPVHWEPKFLNRSPETKVPGQSRPMFCGPSWGNHSCVPLCSPKFRGTPISRVAREAITSSGASSRLAPKRTRKLSPLPAGGDRTFGHLPRPPAVAGAW